MGKVEHLVQRFVAHLEKFTSCHNDRCGTIWSGTLVDDALNRKAISLCILGDCDFFLFEDVDLTSDGSRGDGMISSDHHDLDTGLLTRENGLGDGGTGRIDESRETCEDHVFGGKIGTIRIEFKVIRKIDATFAMSKDTFSLSSKLVVCVLESLHPVIVHRFFDAIDENMRAFGDDSFGSSLHEDQKTVIDALFLVDRDVILVGRVEGDLRDSRIGSTRGFKGTNVVDKLDQSAL